LESIFLPC